MSKANDFYSVNEAKKPVEDQVYHNNNTCPPGSEIPVADRLSGTNGYRLCKKCAELK
ncbi:MAG: hypothetical protein P4L69_05905 [Desulfosporosinus sp.]|nr:hypothetical protein [Desulfosporosinus sp.]